METQTTEYKSLQKIRSGDKGFRELSITCVALANAQGGRIFIGYDDKEGAPLSEQKISIVEANEAVTKLRSLCFNVSLSSSGILTGENCGQYFIITVSPSMSSIASTSDGKFYIRVADKCEPVRSEDMLYLANEKHAFQWELICTRQVKLADIPDGMLAKFADKIRKSGRVSGHIKQIRNLYQMQN